MKKEFEKRIVSSFIIIPIALFFVIKGSIFFNFFLSIFFLATSYEWFKMTKKNPIKIIGILYLFLAFYSAFLLRDKAGLNFFIFIIIICIFTDIGGYIFGKTFKGPKLTKISPNKTYSGVFGSFILSLMAATIFTHYQKSFTLFEIFILNNNELSYIMIILFISAVSQIGDLIVSYFKRLAKIKNTGKLLPGHGGLLDRVDGIIFAIPISYLLFIYLK